MLRAELILRMRTEISLASGVNSAIILCTLC